jgi:hypothetical protein
MSHILFPNPPHIHLMYGPTTVSAYYLHEKQALFSSPCQHLLGYKLIIVLLASALVVVATASSAKASAYLGASGMFGFLAATVVPRPAIS